MRIAVSLEDGDRFLYTVSQEAIQQHKLANPSDADSNVKCLIGIIRKELFFDAYTPLVMFKEEKVGTTRRYDEIHDLDRDLKGCDEQVDSHVYLYKRSTYEKIFGAQASIGHSHSTSKANIGDVQSRELNLAVACYGDPSQKKALGTDRPGGYMNSYVDAENIAMYQFNRVNDSKHLLDLVLRVTKPLGYMVKIGQEQRTKVKDQDVSFVKLQCAYPLKKCPVYLCYRVNGPSSDKSVVFAAQLTHIHALGQVRIGKKLPNQQNKTIEKSELKGAQAPAQVNSSNNKVPAQISAKERATEQERIKREALLKNITDQLRKNYMRNE